MWVKSYIIPTVKNRCIVTPDMEQISLTVQFARLDDRAILAAADDEAVVGRDGDARRAQPWSF